MYTLYSKLYSDRRTIIQTISAEFCSSDSDSIFIYT